MAYSPFDGEIEFKDSANLDAFNRLRISNPETLFEVTHIFDKQSLIIDEIVTGTATSVWQANKSCVLMSVNAASDRVVRQSKLYSVYQPGKSLLVYLTGVLYDAINSDLTCRIGYFDNHADKSVDSGGNGHFFEYSSGNMYVVNRTYTSGSQVDTKVLRSSWNIDTLDDIDFTKTQIFIMDFEWLGVGRVRMGIVDNGLIRYCHQFDSNNLLTDVYMSYANLPIRYEISTSGTPGSMKMICSTVISEGGFNPRGKIFSVDMGVTPRTVTNASLLPLLSIRSNTTHIRTVINPLTYQVLTTSNQDLFYQIVLNGTLTGATFAGTINNIQYDTAATAITGGTIIDSGYIPVSTKSSITLFENTVKLYASIAGTADILTIAVRSLDANATTYGAIQFQEWY